MIATQTTFGAPPAMVRAAPGVNGPGSRLVQTRHRAAAPLIFYPGRFGNAAPTRPQSIDSAGTAHRGGERLGHSVTRAEPHNLRTLTAEDRSPAQRAESAICLCSSGHRIAGVLTCVADRSPHLGKCGGVHLPAAHMFTVTPTAFVPEWMACRGQPYRRLRPVGSMPVGSPWSAKFADYIAKLVVRGGVEPPTFRFSGLRIAVQDWPRWSPCLLSVLRCMSIDAGVRRCMSSPVSTLHDRDHFKRKVGVMRLVLRRRLGH
jgi:hypothetical protein